MQRREFNSMVIPAALGLTTSSAHALEPRTMTNKPEPIQLQRNGWMPNNERLPVLIYPKAVQIEGRDPAAAFEKLFQQNGWPPQWRDGVYDFHHYHSTAHEVLGIAGGQGRLMLGGENGHEVIVHAGDVLLLPTGTGHCRLEVDAAFLVVGAYPPDQEWDICREAPTEEASARMRHLSFPASDPVNGTASSLTEFWKAG